MRSVCFIIDNQIHILNTLIDLDFRNLKDESILSILLTIQMSLETN